MPFLSCAKIDALYGFGGVRVRADSPYSILWTTNQQPDILMTHDNVVSTEVYCKF